MNAFRLESNDSVSNPVPFAQATHQELFDFYYEKTDDLMPEPEDIMLWFESKGWKLIKINRLLSD